MSSPFALCIEDLDSLVDDRFLRCVALPGKQPGLSVLSDGSPVWRTVGPIACELCVSADDRLILFRPQGAAAVRVSRTGRTLDVPAERPVVLLNQDVIEVGPKRMRIHIHGVAAQVAPPSRLRLAGAHTAAIVALGAAVLACDKPVEVRETPPVVAVDPSGGPPPPPPPADAHVADVSTSPATPASGVASSAPRSVTSGAPKPSSTPDRPRPPSSPPGPPIEVRKQPPFVE